MSDGECERYIYRSLDVTRREIRLVEIPARTSPEIAILECRIHTVSLAENPKPKYETVSYCWGDPTPNRPIKIGSLLSSIHANAEKAMRRLALPDRSRTLWIDAICINQLNLEERTQQVTLIADIYSNGVRNLIHLGEGHDELTRRALANIQAVRNDVEEENGLEILRDTGQLGARISRSKSPLRALLDINALRSLYARPWFSRLWVVQEATLASENLCVFEKLQSDLFQLLEFAAFLYHCHSEQLPSSLATVTGLRDAAAIWLCLTFKGRDRLTHLLRRGRQLECSEPRDRVFGVLGIKRWTQVQCPDPEASERLLKPDYKKPVVDVYRDATRAAILEAGDIYAMGLISHRDKYDLACGYPSWTLKLERNNDGNKDPIRLPEGCLYPEMCFQFMEANLPSIPCDMSTLRAPGFTIGTIADCSSILERDPETREIHDHVRHQFVSTCLQIARVDIDSRADRPLRRKLARTLTVNRDHMDHEYSNEQELDQIETFYRFYFVHNKESPSDLSEAEIGDEKRDATSFWTAMQRFCKFRRLCRTACGYIALAPKLARPGDEIVLLNPRGYCCLLRPINSEQHLFIGMCYVDDTRTDELATEFQKKMRRPNRWFSIR